MVACGAGQPRQFRGDPVQYFRRRRLGERRRDEVDAHRAVVGGPLPGQLDAAEPAIAKLSDAGARLVKKVDVGRSGASSGPGQPHPGLARHATERRGDADLPKPPRQKAVPLQPAAAIGNQRQQRLQGAIEQRRVHEVGLQRLADDRWIEVSHGFIIGKQLDPLDGAEPLAVVEPELCGEPIEDGAFDLARRRLALRAMLLRFILWRRHQPRYGVQRQRLVGEARPAAQLPIPVLGGEQAPHFARAALLEWQRPPQFEIEEFQRSRLGAPRARRRQRHLDDRGGRQHRDALDGVVGEPRQQLGVEVVQPKRYRCALAEPEQRMIKNRPDQIAQQ